MVLRTSKDPSAPSQLRKLRLGIYHLAATAGNPTGVNLLRGSKVNTQAHEETDGLGRP